MPEAKQARQLSAGELGPQVDAKRFGFETTDELAPLDELVGQPRALRGLKVGLGLRQPGYHIYAAGISGSGKMEMIRRAANDRARNEPVPDDWVYVNNFADSDQPIAIALPAGRGHALKQDMANLIARLLEELPKAFQREDFSREKDRLRQEYRRRAEEIFDELSRMGAERAIGVQQLPDGQIVFVPLRDGKPISQDEAQRLSPDELQQIERRQQELMDAAQFVIQRQQEVERQLNADVRQVERSFADRLITPLLAEIAERYQNKMLSEWIDRFKLHFLVNLDRFRRRASRLMERFEALVEQSPPADLQEHFLEYQVNLLVDNNDQRQAPVVVEPAPNYRNLFGTVERVVDRFGRVVTNFTQIKAGSLLRANGGYLIFDLMDALEEPFVWKELKRTLKRGSMEIELYDPFTLFTVSGLKPEPIPLNIKLIVVGSPLVYHLLYRYDDEFREIFKIKADFDTEIMPDPGADQGRMYGRLVRKLGEAEALLPFDARAVAVLVEASARIAEHKEKLTAEFSRVCDVVREAVFWAKDKQAVTVGEQHVRQALEEHVYRSNLIAAKIRKLIGDGTLLVDMAGTAVGRVNGLAVADLGDYTFAWPSRVTANVGVGAAGVVNIERESRLSGRTFDKGLLILDGYLRNTYAGEQPLALSAGLAMEQSYGQIDGDSASLAELLCLTSAISRIPLRQGIAVTGSINQWGQVQAIGAVNEKIEGFFDVCREAGLSGSQGVCIPAANVKNLVLRRDVVEAVEQQRFSIWAVDHVDQAIELFSGRPAGMVGKENTFHWQVSQRLQEMAALLKQQRAFGAEREAPVIERQPPEHPDPRPPLPGKANGS